VFFVWTEMVYLSQLMKITMADIGKSVLKRRRWSSKQADSRDWECGKSAAAVLMHYLAID